MSSKYVTKNGKTSKRGAFLNGIWHCDCEPRMPADKFQTRKAGANHGRWFYTCQKAQHKSCNFFLWADEAQTREQSAVLKNSRSEMLATPQTPRKNFKSFEPPTPDTRPKHTPTKQTVPTSALRAQTSLGDPDEEFDWSSGAEEELVEALEIYETPRKAARTAEITSPRKSVQSADSATTDSTMRACDDVFTTPSTSKKHISTGLLTPSHTPATGNSQAQTQSQHQQDLGPASLAAQALTILKAANVPSKIENELVDLLSNYELRTQGIAKGRDISRVAIQTKDRRITELQARIQGLEAERETTRTVISHLKHDMASSPKGKGGRKSADFERTRSEV